VQTVVLLLEEETFKNYFSCHSVRNLLKNWERCVRHDMIVGKLFLDASLTPKDRNARLQKALALAKNFYYTLLIKSKAPMMTINNLPPALQEVLGPVGGKALVEVLNQNGAELRTTYERSLELHLQVMKEFIERRFELANEKTQQGFDLAGEKAKLALQEAKQYTDQRFIQLEAKMVQLFAEADARNEKRFIEAEARNEKRFAEAEARNEKRFAEAEVKMAQSHASLIKWMFTFYVGTVITITGLLIAYIQLALKP
jgi:uncharacterized protein YhaN